jgi:hypothetical protein
LNLRVEDLGPDYATILQTKNGKTRRVRLTPELRCARRARAQEGLHLRPGQARQAAAPRGHQCGVGRLMRSIGLDYVTHHVLRHTGASAMVAAGISLRVVQDIGGWSTLRMLERYAHPSGAEMSRAVRVLTAYTVTGTKTGTATKNDQSALKKRGRVSAVKSGDTTWRPQRDLTRSGRAKSQEKLRPRSGIAALFTRQPNDRGCVTSTRAVSRCAKAREHMHFEIRMQPCHSVSFLARPMSVVRAKMPSLGTSDP